VRAEEGILSVCCFAVNSNNVLSIGSTTITPVKASDTITLDCGNGEEGSDRDEAEGDEDEMEAPSSDDEEVSCSIAVEYCG